jgi:hypothetical protein
MQWWLIEFKPLGSAFTFQVFQGTKAQADAQAALAVNGVVLGPYATKAEAQAAEKKQPGNPNSKPVIHVPVLDKIGQVLSGVNAIGDFFNKLSEANTWLRIAEGLLGGILIAVSLAKLSGVENVVSKAVTKIPVV